MWGLVGFILTKLPLLSEGRHGEAVPMGLWGPGRGRGCPAQGHPRSLGCGPQHLQLVRQEMAVCPEQLSEFLDSLRQYLRGTAGTKDCFQ